MNEDVLPDLTTGNDLRDDEFRILVLYPSDDYNSPLCGRRERQGLIPDGSLSTNHNHKTYEAVSNTWGADVCKGFISIDGVDLPIPFDLKLALKKIRDKTHERRIWADLVCINMADPVEYRHQRSKTRHIFQGAERVFVWLGHESTSTLGALLFLGRFATTRDVEDWEFETVNGRQWQSLEVLMLHPYFTRIWAVQEIALALNVTVLLGRDSLDWNSFQTAIRNVLRGFAQRKTVWSTYVDTQVDRAITFVLSIDKCSRLDEQEHKKLPALSLEALVFAFSTAQASDPRDNIYALLEVAVDVDAWKLKEGFPDYSRSWEEVQKTFYLSCIKQSGSLDIIFSPWRWHQSSPLLFHQAEERDFAVSLLQAPGNTSYNLFDGCHLAPTLRELTVIDSERIFTKGYIFDEVETISDAHKNSDVLFPGSWLSEGFITDALQFARTLLVEAEGADFDRSLNLNRCIGRISADFKDREDYSTRLSKLITGFENLRALTKGRRLFKSRRRSINGLGPAYMRAGDCKCTLVALHSLYN